MKRQKRKLTFPLFGLNCQVLPGFKYQKFSGSHNNTTIYNKLLKSQNMVKISFQQSPQLTQSFYLFHKFSLNITLQTVKDYGDNDDDDLRLYAHNK